jgi:drug/metabolite transporter (DMT)-like permease
VVVVMLLWAICFPLITVGLEASPPMMFAASRAAVSGILLLVVAQLMRRPRVVWKESWRGIVLLGERLRVAQRWGLASGFAGIVLIGGSALSVGDGQRLGMICILLGAVGVAVSNVALKRLAGRVDIVWAMGWQLAIGSLPLAVLAVAMEDPLSIKWTVGFALSLAGLSVLGTAAAFVLWFALLSHAPLNELNVFTFLTPVFGLVLGALFFGEHMHGVAVPGVVLSLGGIYLVNRVPR